MDGTWFYIADDLEEMGRPDWFMVQVEATMPWWAIWQ